MSSPDILFKGIPRGPTRGYTSDVVAAFKPDVVVIPCVGSFALARVAQDAGVSPENVFCGDISLYSTALGNAIMGQDWRLELKNESGEVIQKYLTDPVSQAASVLFMARVLQYNRKNQKAYHRHLQRELLYNAETYMLQLREQIATMRDDLKGIRYAAQDMWITLDAYRDNPKACLLTNPPRYNGGYDRMFKGLGDVFSWDKPTVPQFREKDYARLMDLLGNSPALTLMYYATQGEDPAPLWGDPWRSVFADKPGNSKVAAINWIVANQEPPERVISRTKIEEGKARFSLFDGEIKAESDVRAMRVEKAVGDYYRDLFIHKLPGSITEVYVALLIDGFLSGVVGLHLQNLRTGGSIRKDNKRVAQPANVTFAFTVPHAKYSRLHKLTLMSILSNWFWDDVLGKEGTYELNGAPVRVQTTMLTKHPENKTARGILKMITREPQKDGTYKLSYSGDVFARSRQDTLKEWLTKFGASER